jgi:hypothetical protein
MQNVSALWATLWEMPDTEIEYRFTINGTVYGKESEVSHGVERKLYRDFGIGNATGATLKLELFADDIPRGATIVRECRLVNGNQASEWIPKGTFYTNSRSESDSFWRIEAIDAMKKADTVWKPLQSDVFPMPMQTAVAYACQIMGVTLDERSVISGYSVDYPANDQTWRQTLQYIAAASLGNFIITEANQLRLVPLISAAPAALLVNENGDAITFGEVGILV